MYSHFYFSIDLKIGTNCMKLTGYMAIYKVYQKLTDLGYSFNCTTVKFRHILIQNIDYLFFLNSTVFT